MLIEIDFGSVTPIYTQVADGIRGAIASKRLSPGDDLPPGRALAAALGINLETVQRAYRQLADEGIVTSRVGRGTRVTSHVDLDQLELRARLDALVEQARTLGISRRQLASMISGVTTGP